MIERPNHPASTYDAFAPVYDEFNAQNDYEAWVGDLLLPELEKHGLQVGRVLDIGCGTGRAFGPLIRRGWEVHGCDISAGMLARARRKHRGVPLRCCDAVDLPNFRRDFDLIVILNDVVNYLTSDGDLKRCLEGVERNLAPRGLVCLDVLTLEAIRASFSIGATRQVGAWTWTGEASLVEVGGIGECKVAGAGVEPNYHRVRHWLDRDVKAAAAVSGLDVVAVRGQQEIDGRIALAEQDARADERSIYILRSHA